MDWVMKKKRSVCAAAALVMACNVESLVQDFHDQHGPGTDTAESSGGSTGRGGESTTGVVGMEEGSGGVETSGSGGGSTGSSGEVAGTTGGSTGEESTTGEAVVAECGNSVVEGDEECDDPGDTRCHKCVRDRLVFVTSKNVHGDFAERELAGYDYMCNHLAAVAGLLTNSQPRFKPWVSTSEGSAAERLYHSRGRYVLRNGLVFAESWDALVAGEILNPLNVDENSQTRNAAVFTDTRPDGSAMPGSHCDDWQLADSDLFAYWGDSYAMDSDWSLYVGEATNPIPCSFPTALYCFESP